MLSHCLPTCRTLQPPPFTGRLSGRKPLDQPRWRWGRERTWNSTKSWNGDAGNRGRHDVLHFYTSIHPFPLPHTHTHTHTHSSHPYIFFNQDRVSITFVGFRVKQNGDLIDPDRRGEVLEKAIMTAELYAGLKQNRVNFSENYRTWQKGIMIEKIAMVMGIKGDDPDKSYVLTVDNLIKILAIQMRFRSVCLSVHVCLSVYLSMYPSACACLPLCLFVRLSVCHACLSISLLTCL